RPVSEVLSVPLSHATSLPHPASHHGEGLSRANGSRLRPSFSAGNRNASTRSTAAAPLPTAACLLARRLAERGYAAAASAGALLLILMRKKVLRANSEMADRSLGWQLTLLVPWIIPKGERGTILD